MHVENVPATAHQRLLASLMVLLAAVGFSTWAVWGSRAGVSTQKPKGVATS